MVGLVFIRGLFRVYLQFIWGSFKVDFKVHLGWV